jgi:hypothetical protein
LGNEINEDEKDGACSMGEVENAYKTSVGNMKGKY